MQTVSSHARFKPKLDKKDINNKSFISWKFVKICNSPIFLNS